MLIVLPLGLFITAVIFDALYLWRGNSTFVVAAYWHIVVGIIGGLLAAISGLIDWLTIPQGTRTRRVGLVHGGSNVVVVVVLLFAFVLLGRSEDVDRLLTSGLSTVEIALVIGAVSAGWAASSSIDSALGSMMARS